MESIINTRRHWKCETFVNARKKRLTYKSEPSKKGWRKKNTAREEAGRGI